MKYLLLAIFACVSCEAIEGAEAPNSIGFNKDIRPILSENCFHCHGPDGENRAADLRLDERVAAVDYGAIVPGSPEKSSMIDRIFSDNPDLVMPKPESHKTLTDGQKQLLEQWVAQGAEYQRHWSFEPIAKEFRHARIDSFINEKLKEKGLTASAPASREQWLRRVTLDLTGLPPTIDEIDAFLSDKSENAYEKVVDRLLASPAYGERMASEWLDVARYSDTYGYQVDRDRFVWPWRDWVIRAFNENLPYDKFISQQLAGDILPNPTKDKILATTFNRLHPQKVEGGSVEEEFRVEYVVDRAQTVSTALMGLTFECARCHDHKFDPLTQKEFYELNAFFANINEAGLYSYHTKSVPTPTLPLPNDKQREELVAAEKAVAEAEEKLRQAKASVSGASVASYETVKISGPIASRSFDEADAGKLPVKLVEGVNGKAATLSGDLGVNVKPATFRRWQPFSVSLWIKTPDIKDRAVVFHQSLGWTDAASRGYQLLIEEGKLSVALVHFWPGDAINVRTEELIPTNEWLHVVMTYDGSSRAAGLKLFVNGDLANTEVGQDGLTKEITTKKGHPLTIGERTRDRGFTMGVVDELEIYDRSLTLPEVRARWQQQPLVNLLDETFVKNLSEEERQSLLSQHADQACSAARKNLQEARERRDKVLDKIPVIMVMEELEKLRETHVLDRGVYDARKERVDPATPAALPPMPEGAPANRLGLALWLTSPEHPLTARVAVNRHWQLLFGRGLVVTTEDFGSQGSLPTHPELLDWLAQRFIKSGWDMKALLKAIVLSDTYRRDSAGVGGSEKKDTENLWLARGPATPMTAEMIRDSALATSGLLSKKIGGPPAKPYELAVSFKPMSIDRGDGLYRRSLYTFWKRTAPAPVMLVLDASTRDVCRVRREKTSSPLQAMVLMNGPQYVEAAQAAAAKVLQALGKDSTPGARMKRLFRTLTSRTPTSEELQVLEDLYKKELGYFQADLKATNKYLSVGEFKQPKQLDSAELAATGVVAQAIMNLDDCLMKR